MNNLQLNYLQKYLSTCLLGIAALLVGASPALAASILGSAETFAVLGASTVTCTGVSTITGDLGVSPGTAITGFPVPCTVVGGTHSNDAVAVQAQKDAHLAYAALVAQTCPAANNLTGKVLGTDPGAVTLAPGVYCFDSSAQLTGTLTLSGAGVYIFQIGSTLTTATNSSVVLINGATAGGVFWQVGSSATLGTGTQFAGNILALASITLTTSVNVSGRALALTAAVTMDTNNVNATAATPSGPVSVGFCANDRDGDDEDENDHDRDHGKNDRDHDKKEGNHHEDHDRGHEGRR